MTITIADQSTIEVVHFADPWCWWSWGLEPVLQRLKAVYGDQIRVTYKMGGISNDITAWRKEYDVEDDEALKTWIRDSNSITGMPVDPECYLKTKVRSTWPACVAIKAAELQSKKLAGHLARRLMEEILLRSRNGSEEAVYLEAAREVGLDIDLMRSDIESGKAVELFETDHKAMQASFLALAYINHETGERANVENVFTAGKHEETMEKLTDGKLSKRTPVDILEYLEQEKGFLVGTGEVAEVFATSSEDVQSRLSTLAKDGLIENRTFSFGGSYWLLSSGETRANLTLEQVKTSHVTGPTQVASSDNISEIITKAVTGLYTQVATNPNKPYHFPLGRKALLFVGYPEEEINKLPETALESFAGVGYPHLSGAIRTGDTVLDIGSGSGTDVLFASLKTGPNGRILGLDITEAMIEKARMNIEKFGAKNVKIIKGNATEMPFDDATIDVVTSNGVLNLVPEKERAFREIFRVLKPGGRIQIADIVVQSDVQKVCGLIPQLWADCIGGAAVESEYLRTIKDTGFEDVKILNRIDYFSASESENTKRLTRTFQAQSVVIVGTKPSR